MKRIYVLITVVAIGFLACKDKKNNTPSVQIIKDSTGKEVAVLTNNIAFIDIDTVENKYKFFKNKKAEFEQKQKNIDAELEKMGSALQAEFIDFQKKAQAGQISEAEAQVTQKRLIEKQNQFEQKRQRMGNEFLKQQEESDKQIQDNLRGFLKGYAKEKGYDFILSYSKYGGILYANNDKDITEEVVEALNSGKKYETEEKTSESKTTDTKEIESKAKEEVKK